ncbi:hypothetical protein MPSEU_000300400 [Mayamaea pseudoterrestris]|nr:hypothetical protein MPSEU_000300400 [Mayamaea pseudoterrestris]
MAGSEDAYEAPPLFNFVAHLLTRPRAEYSLDVARYISSGYSSEASDYKAGLIFLACLVGGFAAIWLFVILILKCKGEGVGCASGQAFERNCDILAKQQGESTDMESNQSRSYDDTIEHVVGSTKAHDLALQEGGAESMHSSLPSESDVDDGSSYDGDSIVLEPSRRERRTQFCFFLFGMIALLCVPMILIFSFAPLRQTSEETGEYLQVAQDIVAQVKTSLAAVTIATNASLGVAENLNINFTQQCPGLPPGQTLDDLQNTVSLVADRYKFLHDGLASNLTGVQSALAETDYLLDNVDAYYNETSKFLWLVPCVLLFLSIFVGIALYGVFLAWQDESNRSIQRWLSNGVLPFLILYALSSWAMAAVLAITNAIGSDSCLYGSVQTGSPMNMIGAVLAYSDISPNGTLYNFIDKYTGGCQAGEPNQILQYLEEDVNLLIRYMYSKLSQIDTNARDDLISMCGGDGVSEFLKGSNDLGKLLSIISTALSSSIQSLSCSKVRPIYTHVVEESICSDATEAAAAAFLLFLILGASLLVMISLRAAWTQPIQEQKILKEDEVAENMIVDEHEEYLAYISKYQHEWQEYRGFDSALPCDSGPDFVINEDQSQSSDSSEREAHKIVLSAKRGNGPPGAKYKEGFAPLYDSETQSQSTAGDVSFPSLRSQPGTAEKPPPTLATLLAQSVINDDSESQLLGQEPIISRTAQSVDYTAAFTGSFGSYSLQPGVETIASTKSRFNSTSAEEKDKSPPISPPNHDLLNGTFSPASHMRKREFFFPSSPNRTVDSSSPVSNQNATAVKIESYDHPVTKSERILHDLEEISGKDPRTPTATFTRVTGRLTPTSAVTKMNQRSSPVPTRQFEFGKSVRTASSSRMRQRSMYNNSPLDRSFAQDDCAPSSFSPAPLKVDQYPKAYDASLNDMDEIASPDSTPRSAMSSLSGEQE